MTQDHFSTMLAPDNQEQSIVWVGSVEIGTRLQRFKVIFDTGSDWLAVQGVDCDTYECTVSERYDPDESEVSEDLNVTGKRIYGDLVMKGSEFSDLVCFGGDKCVSDFKFLAADKVKNMPANIEGVLGLGRGPESLVKKLFLEEAIPEPTFSFYFDEEYGAFVDFGAPQEFQI